ncbi:MAG: hypothetical protein R3F30_07395 [Planctomycetota bacterium]
MAVGKLIVDILGDADAPIEVRGRTTILLNDLSCAEAVPALRRIALDPKEHVGLRKGACQALQNCDPAGAREVAMALLGGPDAELTYHSAIQLCATGKPADCPAMRTIFADEEAGGPLRLACAMGLAWGGAGGLSAGFRRLVEEQLDGDHGNAAKLRQLVKCIDLLDDPGDRSCLEPFLAADYPYARVRAGRPGVRLGGDVGSSGIGTSGARRWAVTDRRWP